MFDIGWQELFIVGLLALIVVGPKDLPRVIRTVSGVLRKVKGMAREFQSGLDEVVRDAELQEMRKELQAQGDEIQRNVSDRIDPSGDLTGDFDFSEEERELQSALNDDDTPAEHYEPELPDETPSAENTADAGDAASDQPKKDG